jgi:magnesium-transporting ATPase (P-type)
VGALKQAHVGVALLSGFGDLNVSREKSATDPKDAKNKTASTQVVEAAKPISLALMTDRDFEVRLLSSLALLR